jgi:hypothetical protein
LWWTKDYHKATIENEIARCKMCDWKQTSKTYHLSELEVLQVAMYQGVSHYTIDDKFTLLWRKNDYFAMRYFCYKEWSVGYYVKNNYDIWEYVHPVFEKISFLDQSKLEPENSILLASHPVYQAYLEPVVTEILKEMQNKINENICKLVFGDYVI